MRYWLKAQFLRLERQISRAYLLLSRRDPQHDYPVVFLTYHTLANPKSVSRSIQGEVITPERFRTHIQFLVQHGFQFLTVTDWFHRRPSSRTAVLTFDDGYATVFEEALPVLVEHRAKATVFVTTQFVDGSESPPWGSKRSSVLRDYSNTWNIWRPLSWQQVRQLGQAGVVEIGSHGYTHKHLGSMDPLSIRSSVGGSKRILEERTGSPVTSFSYPFGVAAYGAYSDETHRVLSESGYLAACTGEIGMVHSRTDPLVIPRLPMNYHDQARDLECRMMGTAFWVRRFQALFHNLLKSPFRHEN